MLTTNQKGFVAEQAVVFECAKLGIPVARPLDDQRYDLIFDLGGKILRVQCKWASRRGSVLVVPLYSGRRAADGLRRTYCSPTELDAFAAYSPDTDRCYFATFDDVGRRRALHLRLEPARSNQSKGVCWARDFELGATLTALAGR